MHVAHDVLIHVLAHELSELLVAVIVVGRVVCLVPSGVAERVPFAIDLSMRTCSKHGQTKHAGLRGASVFIPFSMAGLTMAGNWDLRSGCAVLMQNAEPG